MKVGISKKIAVCCIAGFIGLFGIHVDVGHHLPVWLPESVVTAVAVSFLAFSLLFIPVWHFREKKGCIDSKQVLAFWQGVIIYFEVLVFFRFGLLKLFGLHMNASIILSDMPAGSLSGYHLMDYFFARAPGFKILIGCLQILGATVLLFRKTRLAGILILMPVIVNIVCLDLFYEIGGGISLVAIVLTIGLCYLLYQDKERLIRFVFRDPGTLPALNFKRPVWKNAIRISSVGVSLLLLVPALKDPANVSIIGKYEVAALNIDGIQTPVDLNKDSLLSTVYFDEHQTCILKYNDYRKLRIGKAAYHEASGELTVNWRYPSDQKGVSVMQLSKENSRHERQLQGSIAGKKISAILVKSDWPSVVTKN